MSWSLELPYIRWTGGIYGFYYQVLELITVLALGMLSSLAVDKWKTWGIILSIVVGMTLAVPSFLLNDRIVMNENFSQGSMNFMQKPVSMVLLTFAALCLYGIAAVLSAKKIKNMEVIV